VKVLSITVEAEDTGTLDHVGVVRIDNEEVYRTTRTHHYKSDAEYDATVDFTQAIRKLLEG
jgi:hypothetical protein